MLVSTFGPGLLKLAGQLGGARGRERGERIADMGLQEEGYGCLGLERRSQAAFFRRLMADRRIREHVRSGVRERGDVQRELVFVGRDCADLECFAAPLGIAQNASGDGAAAGSPSKGGPDRRTRVLPKCRNLTGDAIRTAVRPANTCISKRRSRP